MKERIRIAIFGLFTVFITCVFSCQYSYDFNLCGTIVNSSDGVPVSDATVQVFPYQISPDEDIEALSSFGKSTADKTDSDGQYKVYYAGTAGGCRSATGPSDFDSLYVRVLKVGYDTTWVAIEGDAFASQFPLKCYIAPPISINPDASAKP